MRTWATGKEMPNSLWLLVLWLSFSGIASRRTWKSLDVRSGAMVGSGCPSHLTPQNDCFCDKDKCAEANAAGTIAGKIKCQACQCQEGKCEYNECQCSAYVADPSNPDPNKQHGQSCCVSSTCSLAWCIVRMRMRPPAVGRRGMQCTMFARAIEPA